MKTKKTVPTDQELEILKIVWRRGDATVRDVYEDLAQERKIAYTTVLTMMGILEQKGHLKRVAGERAYIYSAAQPRKKVEGNMVTEFVSRVFNGSTRPLLLHLVEQEALSRKELEEVEALVKRKRTKR